MSKKANKLIVMSCDPSLTGWGYTIIKGKKVITFGCIRTSAENKKRRIRKGDDMVRRVGEIVVTLLTEIRMHKVSYLVTELPHGSQTASGAVMQGIVMGIMETIARAELLPIEWYSEHDAKKEAIPGKKVITKNDMIEAMEKKFSFEWPKHKYIREAVADALAIYNCAINTSPTLKYLANEKDKK